MTASLAMTSLTSRPAPTVNVEVLICGAEDRGDDGAPEVAAAFLPSQLPEGVRIRAIGRLDVDDLMAIPPGIAVVIVDAATGIPAGEIVDLPLDRLGGSGACRPRSSHAIAAPEVIGLANLLRDQALDGRIVAIGGERFGLGAGLSAPVSAAIPALVASILDAVDGLRS